MKRGLIYCLKCPIKNEIRYVGQTTRYIEKRLKEHKFKIEKRVNKRTNWLNELRKTDIINDLEILVLGEYDINILDDMETKWIVFYLNEGCDLTNTTLKGGFGGYRDWKEEVNKSRSEKLKGRKKKKMSKETRNKISQSLMGKPGRNTGNKHIEETRNKISESKKGTIPHNIKKIKQYDMDGNFIKEWDSSHEASRELNLSQGNIATVASKSGRRKSTGGFRWEWSLDKSI
jgi:group I intron endonuclease